MFFKFQKLGDRMFAQLDLSDAFIVAGLALACVGVWQIYPPAAFIIAGIALFWLGIR